MVERLLLPPCVVSAVTVIVHQDFFEVRDRGDRGFALPEGLLPDLLAQTLGPALDSLDSGRIIRDFLRVVAVKIQRAVHVQGHRPALSDLPPEGIGRGDVNPQCRKVRWAVKRCHVLDDSAVGSAHHADLAVAPRLVRRPLDRVVSIEAFLLVGRVKIFASALGKSPPPQVLQQHHVTLRHEGVRHRVYPDDRVRLVI